MILKTDQNGSGQLLIHHFSCLARFWRSFLFQGIPFVSRDALLNVSSDRGIFRSVNTKKTTQKT